MSKRTNRFFKSTPNSPVKYSPAAEVVGSNVDLLTEILLRVPAKPLIKFKCVSKHWLSLISDSEFGSNHTRRNPNPPVSGMYMFDRLRVVGNVNDQYLPLTLGGRRGTNGVPPLSFLHEAMSGSYPRFGRTIVDSSNGLILCCRGLSNYSYIVCNPTTQKFTTLPNSRVASSGLVFSKEEPYLCFDPTKSPYYKVMVVTSANDYHSASQLAIYTSECASWKNVCLEARVPDHVRGAIWNGGITWIDWSGVSRLDLNTEKLKITRLVRDRGQIGPGDGRDHFEECGGHMLLVQLTESHDAMEVKELELDGDEFRLSVRYWVDLKFFILPNRRSCVISVLGVVKGAQESDLAVVLHNRGKVFSWNLECRTVKVLCELCPRKISRIARQIHLYEGSYAFIESLSPV